MQLKYFHVGILSDYSVNVKASFCNSPFTDFPLIQLGIFVNDVCRFVGVVIPVSDQRLTRFLDNDALDAAEHDLADRSG